MPTYEIFKPYNHDTKVGQTFEAESLHPSLVAHARPVAASLKDLVKAAKVEKTETDPQKPSKPAPNKPAAAPVVELTAAEKRKAALEARKRQEAGQGDATDGEDQPGLTAEQLEALHDEALAEDAERFPADGE